MEEKPGPFQLYVTPVVDVLAVRVTMFVAQVNTPTTDAAAPGPVLFSVTVALAVDWQLVAEFVTTTV